MSTILTPPRNAIFRTTPEQPCVLLVGKESVGKSRLAASLAGVAPTLSNFAGSTVQAESYKSSSFRFIDTPGLLRISDAETTKIALNELHEHDTVLLVVQATQIDEDLADLLPLVVGKRGIVVITFWDKVQLNEATSAFIRSLELDLGVSIQCVDARNLTLAHKQGIEGALQEPHSFLKSATSKLAYWRIEPRAGLLEHQVLGPCFGLLLVFAPALLTIFGANKCADVLHPIVASVFEPLIAWVDRVLPNYFRWLLTSQQDGFGYGLLNMGPFLFVWALPTVVLFSIILGVLKSSGLIDRINHAIDPLVRPIGLSGRDIVRVMMGFGCNVPAVVSTRACSSCSRNNAIAAIAFGAACSYQLPATLAVLSAASATNGSSSFKLSLAYLVFLGLTTVIYIRLTASKESRSPLNVLKNARRPFLQWPTFAGLWHEVRSTLMQFFRQAVPIFVLICMVASLLAVSGFLAVISTALGPLMSLFRLPAEAALPMVMASIRKDGIFLFANSNGLAIPMSDLQVLTAVYLAGVLLPCLVTAMTIGKETGIANALKIVGRQAMFALIFSLILAWSGSLIW